MGIDHAFEASQLMNMRINNSQPKVPTPFSSFHKAIKRLMGHWKVSSSNKKNSVEKAPWKHLPPPDTPLIKRQSNWVTSPLLQAAAEHNAPTGSISKTQLKKAHRSTKEIVALRLQNFKPDKPNTLPPNLLESITQELKKQGASIPDHILHDIAVSCVKKNLKLKHHLNSHEANIVTGKMLTQNLTSIFKKDNIPNFKEAYTHALEQINPLYIDFSELQFAAMGIGDNQEKKNLYIGTFQQVLMDLVKDGQLAKPENFTEAHLSYRTKFLETKDVIESLSRTPGLNDLLSHTQETIKQVPLVKVRQKYNNIQRQNAHRFYKMAKKDKLPSGISIFQKTNLQLLNVALEKNANKQSLSPTEKEMINIFLLESINNRKLNGILRGPFKKAPPLFNCSNQTIEFVSKFTHKSRELKYLETAIPKANAILKAMEAGDLSNINPKLTRSEYGAMIRFAEFQTPLLELKNKGVLQDPTLMKIASFAETAHLFTSKMEAEFQKLDSYTPRDIFAERIDQREKFKNRRPDLPHKILMTFISRHEHVAKFGGKSEHDGEMKNQLSHVVYDYTVTDLTFADSLFIDTFRLDVSKLAPEASHSDLKNILGENWKNELNKLYESIESKLHSAENQRKLEGEIQKNSWKRKLNAAKTDILVNPEKKRKNQSAFKDIRDQMFFRNNASPGKDMICSEFVAKTTVAALVELNDQLHQMAQEKNLPVSQKELIEIPFKNKKHATGIIPSNLVDQLVAKGCVAKLPHNSLRAQIIEE